MKIGKRLLTVTLLLLFVFAGGYWVGRRAILRGAHADRMAQLESENLQLRSSAEGLRSENAKLREDLDEPDGTQGSSKSGPKVQRETRYLEDTHALRTLQEALASANQSIAEWEARGSDLQSQLEKLKEDNRRLTTNESDIRQQLASARQSIETMQADLKSKDQRLGQLETANKKLSEEGADASHKVRQLSQASNELQEIHRRRESYLNSLSSRYRDVTDQYRAFVSVLENRRGPEGTTGSAAGSVGGPELARIQNSISLAEEDIRQLNTLNAQAARIHKRFFDK